MPWGLKHFQESGQWYFLIFSCYPRRANVAPPQSCDRRAFAKTPPKLSLSGAP